MDRAARVKTLEPHLVGEVWLYPTDQGGRKSAMRVGICLPCMVSVEAPLTAWDGFPLLGDEGLEPGQRRRLGFHFLSGEEAAGLMRAAGKFFLWDGRPIGEVLVVDEG